MTDPSPGAGVEDTALEFEKSTAHSKRILCLQTQQALGETCVQENGSTGEQDSGSIYR